MGTIIYLLTVGGATLAVIFPWIGVIDGYVSVLLGPHVIWWWAFIGSRHFYYITLGVLLGSVVYILLGKINYLFLLNKQNALLFGWFFAVTISYYFGPYVETKAGPGFFSPTYIYPIVVKSFIFYFLSALLIDAEHKFKILCSAIIIIAIYFIYWINSMYLAGNYGRLGGPIGLNSSQYGDQNNFAMFFIISLPFLYYFSLYLKNKLLRYGLWLLIPLGWHAIFLTGSRGGFLGLVVITILIIFQSKVKKYGVILLCCLLIVFIWQGGDVLKGRTTIYNAEGTIESSAQGRLNSWAVALKMIEEYPLTGVGVSSFGAAFPFFSDAHPLEAHNTYLQICAESGLLALFFYVSFLFYTLKKLYEINRKSESESYSLCMSKALLLAWVGFSFCALFLSLQVFEQFFYLAVLSNYVIVRYGYFNEGVG